MDERNVDVPGVIENDITANLSSDVDKVSEQKARNCLIKTIIKFDLNTFSFAWVLLKSKIKIIFYKK